MANTTTKRFLLTFQTFSFSDEKEQEFKKKVVSAVEKDDGTFTSAEIREVFVEAAQLGLTQVVNLFLTTKKNLVDVVNSFGNTALFNASLWGREETVACLLAVGANVNKPNNLGRTPLVVAILKNHEKIVAQLIFAKADVNKPDKRENTPLWYAARDGNENLVAILMAANADITEKTIKVATADATKKTLRRIKAQQQLMDDFQSYFSD